MYVDQFCSIYIFAIFVDFVALIRKSKNHENNIVKFDQLLYSEINENVKF